MKSKFYKHAKNQKSFITLLIGFLLSFNLLAQQEINTSFKTQMNTMFSPLDKSRIPHGILLDFGMEFTNVEAFNGTITDSTYVSSTRLKEIYNTLLSSRIRDVNTGFVTPQQLEQNWKNQRNQTVITLSGLYFKYSKFINNATTSGKLIYSGGKFYDKFVNGVWQNPYQEAKTFAIATPIKYFRGLTLQVKIPTSIFYSNYKNEIQSLQIDFADGLGYRTVAFDQLISVNYTTDGAKNWKYKLNLTNGTSLYSHSFIKVEATELQKPYVGYNPMVAPQTQSQTSINSLYYHNITASNAYLGTNATVRLTIDDAGNDGIRKPLIVAEGFDVGIIIDPENVEGLNTYSDFHNSVILYSGSELNNLLTVPNHQYDIIYVNWNNGADYLQRNAFALQTVIEWVNQQKALTGSTEKNVVLGQSMGGVIARYTLAHMEQNNINHDTRLFVSHDAPQQGANMPVSLQYLYRHATNQYISMPTALLGGEVIIPLLTDNQPISSYLSILDVPASRQLLSNWSNLNYTIDNNFHQSFYNELKSKGLSGSGGYPTLCRNVALSNGAECGTIQNFIPGDLLVNYQWNKGLSFWGDLLSLIYNPLGGIIGGALVDEGFYGVAVLGLIPGHSTYNIDFQARAIPYGSGNQIYKGVISYTKKILWLIPVTVNITNVQKNQPAGVLPMDTYGGGYYNASIVSDRINIQNLYIRDRFDFIPTVSALDIGKGTIALNDNDYMKSYVGALPPIAPKNSPFVNFSTEYNTFNPNSQNYQHITFNSRNGEWLAKEITNAPINTNCSYMCTNAEITGASNLCSSSTYTAPSGGTYYNWSITQGANLVTLSGNGTSNITLTALPNASGQVTLTLNLGDNWTKCGNITLTKTISVGKPQVYVDFNNDCAVDDNFAEFQLKGRNSDIATQGVTQIIWTKLSGTTGANMFVTNNNVFGTAKGPGNTWYINAKVDVINSCGTTTHFFTITPPPPCESDPTYKLAKSESELSIFDNKNEKINLVNNDLIEIYNRYGIKIKTLKENQINIDNLEKGFLIIKLYKDNKVIDFKIILN